MPLRFVLLSFALLPLGAVSAGAQVAVCTLVPTQEGEITLGADLMNWRTTRPAVVDAVTTAPATLFVNTPTSWALHPGRTPGTGFGVSTQLSGANGGQLLPGGGGLSGALSTLGTTHAAVSLTATASSTFPAGAYSAEVTVTCAPR